MKNLLGKSILEILCIPLLAIKLITNSWNGEPRQPYIYEHVFAPVVFAVIAGFLPYGFYLYLAYVFVSILIKELFYDIVILKKQINIANIIERLYGSLLGFITITINKALS